MRDDERAWCCECVSLTGRKSIAEYWALKLETKLIAAFTLNNMKLSGDGVQVDYLSYESKPVRINFRFSSSGKILHTSCGPSARCNAA
jgi:hypothetical protein